jgi:D-3-phosphoglycerate dehydrogenase
MKIVVCDHIHSSGLEILESEKEVAFENIADLGKGEEFYASLHDATVIITRSSTDVDEKLLNSSPNLKAIVRAGVGVDNVDIDACSNRGVIVMNVPTANTIAAVELTMAHILSNMRFFPYAHNHLKQDRVWKREKWYGHELKGKKLGIIGFGNIGSRVGIRAKSFEMEVLAFDPYISASKATDLGINFTKDFGEILDCDVITIHTPKNEETIDMISTEEISKMRDGVVLINCARGGLYNEEALLEGLKSGKIRSAGIDVFSKEPATDHPLLDLENVTVTPHLGANTFESQRNIGTQAAQQALEAVKGVGYPNALNLPIDDKDVEYEARPYLHLVQKLGFISAQLNRGDIQSIKLYAEGKDVNGYSQVLQKFATVGVLKESLGDSVNFDNYLEIAQEQGITISNGKFNKTAGYRNRVGVKVTTDNRTIRVAGTLFGEDDERVIEIDGFEFDIKPEGNIVLFENSDVPGVIGEVGTILGSVGTNIADFRLGRNGDGKAMAVIHTDQKVTKETLAKLETLESCISVSTIRIV